MHCRLDHVAVYCKDIQMARLDYRELFGGEITEIRTGAAGYPFCFVKINGQTPIQLCESKDFAGIHHYGFVAEDLEKAATEFQDRGAKIVRKNRDSNGNLTAVFLLDPAGIEVEIR